MKKLALFTIMLCTLVLFTSSVFAQDTQDTKDSILDEYKETPTAKDFQFTPRANTTQSPFVEEMAAYHAYYGKKGVKDLAKKLTNASEDEEERYIESLRIQMNIYQTKAIRALNAIRRTNKSRWDRISASLVDKGFDPL